MIDQLIRIYLHNLTVMTVGFLYVRLVRSAQQQLHVHFDMYSTFQFALYRVRGVTMDFSKVRQHCRPTTKQPTMNDEFTGTNDSH